MHTSSVKVGPDLSLPSYIWPSKNKSKTKGCIIFLHGFCNHGKNYSYLGEWFSEQGYDFIAYDHRDHGESPLRNQQCTIDELVGDAIKVVDANTSADLPCYIMGSSMGGALSILAATHKSSLNKFAGVILLAPQVVSTHRRKLVFQYLSKLSRVIPGLKLPSGPIARINLPKQCNDKVLCEKMAKDKLMLGNPNLGMTKRVLEMGDLAANARFNDATPVLMLYGGNDTLVFKHDIKQFVNKLKQAGTNILYHFYPENRHMLWGEMNRHDLYQDILNWMETS